MEREIKGKNSRRLSNRNCTSKQVSSSASRKMKTHERQSDTPKDSRCLKTGPNRDLNKDLACIYEMRGGKPDLTMNEGIVTSINHLKGQIESLKGMIKYQSGTIQKFNEALEENKTKNKQLESVLLHFTAQNNQSSVLNSVNAPDRLPSQNPEFSEALNSLMSYSDLEFFEKMSSEKKRTVGIKRNSTQSMFLSFLLGIKL